MNFIKNSSWELGKCSKTVFQDRKDAVPLKNIKCIELYRSNRMVWIIPKLYNICIKKIKYVSKRLMQNDKIIEYIYAYFEFKLKLFYMYGGLWTMTFKLEQSLFMLYWTITAVTNWFIKKLKQCLFMLLQTISCN